MSLTQLGMTLTAEMSFYLTGLKLLLFKHASIFILISENILTHTLKFTSEDSKLASKSFYISERNS